MTFTYLVFFIHTFAMFINALREIKQKKLVHRNSKYSNLFRYYTCRSTNDYDVTCLSSFLDV